ncbi:NmrA family NAD(P)-binding protein [Streptomyces sp. S.PNR 29]|uniref:NmrA family NAD(P)-binding protein n=1 Tax=Streptomyces sp. S.PNR 29 TaxID=2973805 RepID=UPI0025B16162|nr:NmrA family NAD(P)-binding protein [Streptomyces sp. S.PNR 29]MDN0201176.1 NmrA family NAD(P)-binding protein [Streptomyces sp. S.PNR 29]
MTTPVTALVIGATGTTGSRVARGLAARGHRVKAACRRTAHVHGGSSVRFDWYDRTTYEPALSGTDRVYLVPPLTSAAPADIMLPFLEQARASGVRRAVLLSSSAIPAGGPAVGQVHQALPALFDEWAVLRPSWFMQNFTGDHLHAQSIRKEGVLLTAAGEGRVAFVDADDIAAVAVHALTDVQAPDSDLVITGPETLSHSEVATVLSEVTGRAVTHRQLTYEQMRDHLARTMPPEFAAMLAGMDRAIAEGAEDRTTDTVLRVTGRRPRSFRAHVEQTAVP